MKLYTYFRSTAAYRVRIALNLKKIPYTSVFVNLRKSDHLQNSYQNIHAQQFVPTLELNDGRCIHQSLSIIDYLDHTYPSQTILPDHGTFERYIVLDAAYAIACDIHPLNNLRVLTYLKNAGFDPNQETAWYHNWLKQGFDALEKWAKPEPYFIGKTLTLADIFLIPQIYNAHRFQFDMAPYPKLISIYNHALTQDSFIKASPEKQEDWVA